MRITSIQHTSVAGATLAMPNVSVRWSFSGKYEGQDYAGSAVVQFMAAGAGSAAAAQPAGVKSSSGEVLTTATLDAATGKYYVSLYGAKMNGVAVVAGSEVNLKCWVDNDHEFTLNVKNDSGDRVDYKVMQDGQMIDWFSLGPGENRSKGYKTDSGNPITVNETPRQFFTDFATGQKTLGGDGPTKAVNLADDGNPIIPTPSPGVTPPNKSVTTPPAPSGTATSPDGVLWSVPKETVAANQLDKATFKEGVDALIKAVKSSGGGGGGTTVDLSGVHSRLDTVNTKLDTIDGSLKTTAPTEGAFDEENAADVSFLDSSSVIGTLAKLPAAPAVIKPTTGSTVIAASIPMPGASNFSFSVDFSNYATPILILRNIIKALLYFGFFFVTVRALKEAFA